METNLKLVENKIDENIDPNAGVGEILAQKHNEVLKEVFKSSGKYVGFNFEATKNTSNIVLPGQLVFGDNAINQSNFFVLKVSNKDKFNLDVGVLLQVLSSSAFLSFKDYEGRATIFEFQSYTSEVDTNGNPYYGITLKSITSNSNYSYQNTDNLDCVLNFFYSKNEYGITDFKGWASPSTVPSEDGWYYADSTGVYTGFNDENVDLTNGITILISKSVQTVFKQIVYPSIQIENGIIEGSEKIAKSGDVYNSLKLKANLIIGKNKFNINDSDVVIGKYISIGGVLSSNTTYNTTGFIPVLPSTQYRLSYRHNIAYYDIDKNLILFEATDGNTQITSPANAYYLRCTVHTGSWVSFQVELGLIQTTFTPFKLEVNPDELDLSALALQSSLEAVKEDYLKKSKGANLINPLEVVDNFYLTVNGGLAANNSWKTTGFIPFKQTDIEIISNLFATNGAGGYNALFDEDKNFISSFQGNIATWVSGVAYVRFSGSNIPANYYANVGNVIVEEIYSELKNLVNEGAIINESVTNSKIKDLAITTNKLTDKSVTVEKADFFELGTNLFNIFDNDIAIDFYVASGSGNLSANTTYNATGFIPVLGDTDYIISYAHQRAWYDENKNYISGITSNGIVEMTSPANARFSRCTVLKAEWDLFQFNKGSVLLDYKPYGLFLKSKYIDASTIIETPFFPKLALPRKLHVLLNNENSIYHKAYLERYNPYKFAVEGNGTNWKHYERYIRLNADIAGDLTIKSYDAETLALKESRTLTVISGDPVTDNGAKTINVIGDSFSYNGAWYDKANSLCPNLIFVGIRKPYGSVLKGEGRGGWRVSTFMTNVKGSATDSFSPYLHPVAPYTYYGGTDFWKEVKAGSTAYGINGFQDIATSIGFDANGVKLNPQLNDVMWNNLNSRYEKYNGTVWELIDEATLNFSFNYSKYLDTWNLSMPDYVAIMLGTNDFRSSMPSDANLDAWKIQMDTIFASILQAGIDNSKTVRVALCLPTTETESANNTSLDNPIFQRANMWKARNFIINTFDVDEYSNQGLDIVDTGSALDGDYGFGMTNIKPFEDYPGSETELLSGNTPHPSTEGYWQLGVRFAGYIQSIR